MTLDELIALLHENGFYSNWTLSDGKLIQWEHDEDPPAPLTRPDNNA
jgi:hypothetical protein